MKMRIGVLLICVSLLGAKGVREEQAFAKYNEPIAGTEFNIDMVPISGGKFQMGSPSRETGRKDDEGPVREVEVGDFWMSTLEITWDQYEIFLYREKEQLSSNRGDLSLRVDAVSGATMPYVNYNKPGHPLVNITQYAAATFCKWLSAKTGRYYRLPTEAEWEYACRAGGQDAYSFGSGDIDEYAWYKGNSSGTFQKGGQKKPNGYGLYDMHGNVAEWVTDGYYEDGYTTAGSSNPVKFAEDLYPRVVRGGSWMQPEEELRSASRGYSDPQWKKRDPQFPKSLWWMTDATHVGFRIVRPKNVPSKAEMEKYWGEPIEEY